MSTSRKAQVSVEFTLLLAVSLAAILLIVILANQQVTMVQNQKDESDAKNAILDLSAAAKEVYAQGEGSRKLVYVRLPSSYDPDASYVGNKSIRIRVAGTDHVSVENFNVHGHLPSTSGGHQVWVVSEGNRVRIGLAMMELGRNRIYVVMPSNSTSSQSFSVKNIWTTDLGITTDVSWSYSEVLMGGIPVSFMLDPNNTEVINAQFSASESSGGVYTGEIVLEARDTLGSIETTEVPVTVHVIRPEEEALEEDILGPIITGIHQDPLPAIKLQPLTFFVSASDELTGNGTVSACQIDADNSGSWKNLTPLDGAYDAPLENSSYTYAGGFSLGVHSIRAFCTDDSGNTGPTSYYFFNVTEADQLGPIVIQMQHSQYPTTLSTVQVWGVATDEYTGGSNIGNCSMKVDDGFWEDLPAEDGAWDAPTENFSATLGELGVGYHTVYYQCTDEIGNIGGIYNDSFGVVDVDLMLVLDRSGSMAWMVTNSTSGSQVSTTNTGWTRLKNLTVTANNGDLANLTVEFRTSVAGCEVNYEARQGATVLASGETTSAIYQYYTTLVNVSGLEPPYDIALYARRNTTTSCTAYARFMALRQEPDKLYASQEAAKTFLDISGNSTYAGLISFSTSATTDETLAVMNPTNLANLKSSIDSMSASGSTCLECGLVYAADELTSARARPDANKVIVFLTDGVGNYGLDGYSCGVECSVAGAVYCRERNVTVYTIGFGDDVDDTELTNIAWLTGGEYYFAPNVEVLTDIFMNIGR